HKGHMILYSFTRRFNVGYCFCYHAILNFNKNTEI
ncbi:MAG: hypothetical protein ACI86L_002076, partial [Dokdonia sp.]